MNLTKKLFSYLVALTMVLSLAAFTGVKVHAATGNYKITLEDNAETKTKTTDHTYHAYQIFSGGLKVNEDKTKVLSNIQWGTGIDSSKKDALISALKSNETLKAKFGNVTDAASVAKALEGVTSNSTEMDAFAQVVGQHLSDTSKSSSVNPESKKTEITDLAAGYYLVKDTLDTDEHGKVKNENDAYTKFIVDVVGDITATIKSDVPTVEKKVKDINDSTDTTTTDWQDSADYDIGDEIPYKLTGTLPTNYDNYNSYYYKFTDTMTHLTYKEGTLEVKANGSKVDSDKYTAHFDAETKTLTVEFGNLKDVIAEYSSTAKVTVEYRATLDQDANIGSTGNPNKVDLTYSNNPNNSGNGETGKTPEDKNIVFTYAAKFNKVDGSNKPLADAKFTLYKFTTNKIAESDIADKHNNVSGYWHSLGEKEATKQDDNYTAYYKGLDDGVYKLVETHTPDGYNTMADKIFTVTATHNDGDEPSFDTLTVNDLTTTINDGTFTSDIQNKKGSTLPSTGGMGTTLLYVAGGILVACAAAYVVLNKKRA